MRVLLDTNIFISYLLEPEGESSTHLVLEAALLGKFNLLLPEEVLEELQRKIPSKRYLAERITPENAEKLVTILRQISEVVPRIELEIPALTRDPKDDYLLAHAVVGEADYLVTGDDDLLVLKEVEGVKIVTAGQFWEIMEM